MTSLFKIIPTCQLISSHEATSSPTPKSTSDKRCNCPLTTLLQGLKRQHNISPDGGMVDALASGASVLMDVEVRVLFWAPPTLNFLYFIDFPDYIFIVCVPRYSNLCTVLIHEISAVTAALAPLKASAPSLIPSHTLVITPLTLPLGSTASS